MCCWLMSVLTLGLLSSSPTLLLFTSPRSVCYTARECIDPMANVLLLNSAAQQPGRKLKQAAGAHHGESDYTKTLLLWFYDPVCEGGVNADLACIKLYYEDAVSIPPTLSFYHSHEGNHVCGRDVCGCVIVMFSLLRRNLYSHFGTVMEDAFVGWWSVVCCVLSLLFWSFPCSHLFTPAQTPQTQPVYTHSTHGVFTYDSTYTQSMHKKYNTTHTIQTTDNHIMHKYT